MKTIIALICLTLLAIRVLFTEMAQASQLSVGQTAVEPVMITSAAQRQRPSCPVDIEIDRTIPTLVPGKKIAFWPSGNDGVVYPKSHIAITFDRPMDKKKTEAAVLIDPPGVFTRSWQGNTLIIETANGCLTPNDFYIVDVGVEAVDVAGNPVFTGPQGHSFFTANYDDLFSFGSGSSVDVVMADGLRHVPFRAFRIAPNTFHAAFHLLTQEQFLTIYRRSLGATNTHDDSQLPLFREWDVAVKRPLTPFAIHNIQLPADAPLGFYLLTLEAAGMRQQLLVVLTNQTVMVKESPLELLAWVTDNAGNPKPNVEVTAYGKGFGKIGGGVTDKMGVWQGDVKSIPSSAPYIVIATDGDDRTVAFLEAEWRKPQPDRCETERPLLTNRQVQIYTDKPVYRVGDTISFAAFIFEDKGGVFTPLAGDIPVVASLGNNHATLYADETGRITGTHLLAQSGTSLPLLSIEGERYPFPIQVLPEPPVSQRISLTASDYHYRLNHPITITAVIANQHGTPLAGVPVSAAAYIDNLAGWVLQSMMTVPEGVTDENGRFSFTFNNIQSDDWSPHHDGRWAVVVTTPETSETLVLQPRTRYQTTVQAILTPTLTTQLPGKLFPIQGKMVEGDTTLMSNRPYTLTVTAQSYPYETQTAVFTTDIHGMFHRTVSLSRPGSYNLFVQDEYGKKLNEPIPLHLLGFEENDHRFLKVISNKASYAPGEVATLFVLSKFSGTAMLTVERATVRRQEVITLTQPLTELHLPIEANDSPNMVVSINGHHPAGGLHVAFTDLTIQPPILNIQLSTTAQTDQTQTFTVQVTNHQGQPIQTTLLANFTIAPHKSINAAQPQSLKAFYQPQPHWVATYHSQWASRNLQMGYSFYKCLGGYLPLEEELLFSGVDTTAVWLPNLQTNAQGKATFTLPRPPAQETWQLAIRTTTAQAAVGELVLTLYGGVPGEKPY